MFLAHNTQLNLKNGSSHRAIQPTSNPSIHHQSTMADTTQGSAAPANVAADKGKGKSTEPPRDVNMEGEDSSSEEELDEVSPPHCTHTHTRE